MGDRASAKAHQAGEAQTIAGDRPPCRPPAGLRFGKGPGERGQGFEFWGELLELVRDHETRRLVLDLLQRHASDRLSVPSHRSLMSARRVEVARRMLFALRATRADVVKTLEVRFGVSERTAQRDVGEALQVRHDLPPNGGGDMQSPGIENVTEPETANASQP